jgi:large subunit ribosomal protein L21e
LVNKKAKGKRAKTRAKLKAKPGKATLNQLLRPFQKGAAVQVDIRPEMHKGMPPAIYQGSFGVVQGKQGKAYKVDLRKGKLAKSLVVAGIHLKQLEARH